MLRIRRTRRPHELDLPGSACTVGPPYPAVAMETGMITALDIEHPAERSGVPAFRRSGVPAFRRSACSFFSHNSQREWYCLTSQ